MFTKQAKKKLTRILLACEVVIFIVLYLFGAQGLRAIWQLQQDNVKLDGQLRCIQQEVTALHKEVVAWSNDPFYKEKIARERLHMARKDDLIFIK